MKRGRPIRPPAPPTPCVDTCDPVSPGRAPQCVAVGLPRRSASRAPGADVPGVGRSARPTTNLGDGRAGRRRCAIPAGTDASGAEIPDPIGTAGPCAWATADSTLAPMWRLADLVAESLPVSYPPFDVVSETELLEAAEAALASLGLAHGTFFRRFRRNFSQREGRAPLCRRWSAAASARPASTSRRPRCGVPATTACSPGPREPMSSAQLAEGHDLRRPDSHGSGV